MRINLIQSVKAFCKTSYAKIGAMEYLTNNKHDENKVKILIAFAMIVNKHKDDVLVKPLANKNVKKNQRLLIQIDDIQRFI